MIYIAKIALVVTELMAGWGLRHHSTTLPFCRLFPIRCWSMSSARDGPGTPMPAFLASKGGSLTDMQVKTLAMGIKKQWGLTEAAHGSIPPYSVESVGATGDKNRGASVFGRACASCHGPSGEGGETGDGKAGAINDPAFLALISDQTLRRYAITGRPDLVCPTMLAKPGAQPSTSRSQVKRSSIWSLLSSRGGKRIG